MCERRQQPAQGPSLVCGRQIHGALLSFKQILKEEINRDCESDRARESTEFNEVPDNFLESTFEPFLSIPICVVQAQVAARTGKMTCKCCHCFLSAVPKPLTHEIGQIDGMSLLKQMDESFQRQINNSLGFLVSNALNHWNHCRLSFAPLIMTASESNLQDFEFLQALVICCVG